MGSPVHTVILTVKSNRIQKVLVRKATIQNQHTPQVIEIQEAEQGGTLNLTGPPRGPSPLPLLRTQAPESTRSAPPLSRLFTSECHPTSLGEALHLPLEDSMEDTAQVNAPTGSGTAECRMPGCKAKARAPTTACKARSRVARTTRHFPRVGALLLTHQSSSTGALAWVEDGGLRPKSCRTSGFCFSLCLFSNNCRCYFCKPRVATSDAPSTKLADVGVELAS